MTRVHFRMLILSALTILQGCASLHLKTEAAASHMHIIRFADSMGAVFEGGAGASPDDIKLRSMLAAFEQCQISHQLAFVTAPIEFFPAADYSFVSAYDLQHGRFLADSAPPNDPAYVAPFECIDQKHGLESPIHESREVTTMLVHNLAGDMRGAIVAVKVEPNITGLKNGDLILAIADQRVETRTELAKAVDWLPLGPTKYSVIRANSVIRVDGEITDRTPTTLKTAKNLLTEICNRLRSTSKTCGEKANIATNP